MRQEKGGATRAEGSRPDGGAGSEARETLESPASGDHPALRTGEAGFVWLSGNGELETNTRVELSPNSTHALLGHGVVEALNRLPLELAPVGSGRDTLIPQALLDDASDVFYEADRKTYGAVWCFDLLAPGRPTARLRIDNREYQRTLARLQDLVRSASRAGFAVRLRI